MVDRVSLPFLNALAERALVADGVVGTMRRAQDLSLDQFAGLEGYDEIRNVTRPDVAGAGAVETDTLGVARAGCC